MSTIVIVRFHVKEDHVTAFTAAMRGVKESLPKVDGCEQVQAFVDADRPRHFTLVERWSSRERHQAHISHLKESGVWEKLSAQLESAAETHYHTEL